MLVHVDRIRLLCKVVRSNGASGFGIDAIVLSVMAIRHWLDKTIAAPNLLFHLRTWFQSASVQVLIFLGVPSLPSLHIAFREFMNIDSLSRFA